MKLLIVNNPYPALAHLPEKVEVDIRYVQRKMSGVFVEGKAFGVRKGRWYFFNSDVEIMS